jgi:large subunit ribosomal protein L25
MLMQSMNSLHVEALPADLPRSLEVDLSVLKELGQSIAVKDIPRSDKIEILNDPHLVVAQVSEVRAPVEEEVVKVKAEAEVEGEAPAEGAEEAETR